MAGREPDGLIPMRFNGPDNAYGNSPIKVRMKYVEDFSNADWLAPRTIWKSFPWARQFGRLHSFGIGERTQTGHGAQLR